MGGGHMVRTASGRFSDGSDLLDGADRIGRAERPSSRAVPCRAEVGSDGCLLARGQLRWHSCPPAGNAVPCSLRGRLWAQRRIRTSGSVSASTDTTSTALGHSPPAARSSSGRPLARSRNSTQSEATSLSLFGMTLDIEVYCSRYIEPANVVVVQGGGPGTHQGPAVLPDGCTAPATGRSVECRWST